MKNLYIFDVSGIVYYGTTGTLSYVYKGMQVSGIKALTGRLTAALAEHADVILAFDARSFRKDLLDVYKGDRVPNRYVGSQLDLLMEMLEKAGIPCYKFDGYEADDIISWAVKEFRNSYTNTCIYSNDYDVAHNVQERVYLKPIDNKSNIVTHRNFASAVSRKDDIMFNTISAHKVFCGCTSDRVPAIKVSGGYTPVSIYKRFCRFLHENNLTTYEATSDPRTVAIFANTVGLFSDEDKQEVYKRIQIIYPANKPEDAQIKPVGLDSIDKEAYSWLLAIGKDYSAAKALGIRALNIPQDVDQHVKVIYDLVRTGAYSVDRNLEVDPSYEVDSEMMFLKEF